MLVLLLSAMAAAEDEEAPPEDVDLFAPAAPTGPAETVRWRVGAAAGVGLPVDPVSVSPTAEAAVSRALPVWDGRLRPRLSVGISTTGSSGELEDPRLPEALTHETRLLAVMLGVGLEAVLLPDGMSPYLLAAPLMNLTVTTSSGAVGSAPVSATREGRVSPGFAAGAGILSPLGGGEIFGGIHYTHLAPGGVLAGADRARSVAPMLGYRFHGGTR